MDRRRFLGSMIYPAVGAAALAPMLSGRGLAVAGELDQHGGAPADVARDEAHWFEVQQAFTIDRSLINLNNGGVSPLPAVVQAAMKRHLDYSNTAPTYAM